jgi:hypothetical protein
MAGTVARLPAKKFLRQFFAALRAPPPMINFPSRAARDRYEFSLLCEETTRLSLETAAKLHAKLRNVKDIVHDWDDPRDFSMWASAFAVLKPPRE